MRILHVLRAPVGGLFRHVRDLATEQASRGHAIGVLCDASTSDSLTEQRLSDLSEHLALGLHRINMPRGLGLGDVAATQATKKLIAIHGCDVVHGHGAKGGAYARLAVGGSTATERMSQTEARAYYTPHGGSLHYAPSSVQGRIFMALEQRLSRATSGLIFESAFSQKTYRRQVGPARCPERVIANGLLPSEFFQHTPAHDAADVLFIGELRDLKGIDILLEGLSKLRTQGHTATATIVGDGPDAAKFRAMADDLSLSDTVTFTGALPAAKAFPRGRILVVPSRAESFPYIVLEAAAQAIPMIATDVGGIPEIVGQGSETLIPSKNSDALAAALVSFLNTPEHFEARAQALQARASDRFSVAGMTTEILTFYRSFADSKAA
ncbi:MAG: glycosyltransferase family 4 protein [Pseudomonadota bacterium]